MAQIEIDIEELAKAKKRVWVKTTSTRKGHYREMEVGEKEGKGVGRMSQHVEDVERLISERDKLVPAINSLINEIDDKGKEISKISMEIGMEKSPDFSIVEAMNRKQDKRRSDLKKLVDKFNKFDEDRVIAQKNVVSESLTLIGENKV